MFKAIGHCRVSKGDTDEIKNSLKSQKSQIQKFAQKLGIETDEIKWFIEDEARSAYSDRADWSLFEEAIKEACSNKDIKYFIDFSQERFCRNRKKSQQYKDKLRKNAVNLRFVNGDVEDPDSDSGFWQDGIQEMVAEAYSRKVGADTLRGCLENAVTRDPESGLAFKNGGSPPWWLKAKKIPIGKDKYGDDIKKTIWIKNDLVHTVNTNEKPTTKTMWEWARFVFMELRINKEYSLDKVRDYLNQIELPAPRSKYWTSTGLYDSEKNEALMGIGYYNRRQYSRGASGRFKDRSEWIEVKDAHPALLSKSEFELLQNVRAKNKRVKGSNHLSNDHNYLLSGNPEKFTCNHCGGRIITSGGVYTCGTYNSYGRKACNSNYFSLDQTWIEDKVINEIVKYTKESILDKIYDQISKKFNDKMDINNEINSLDKILNEKEKASANLIDSLSNLDSRNNAMAFKTITTALEKISKEIESIKIQIDQAKKHSVQKVPTKEEVKNHLGKLKAILTHSTPKEKRKIVWMFLNSLRLDPIERSVIAEFNFDPIRMILESTMGKEEMLYKSEKTQIGSSTKLVAGVRFELTTFGL